MPDLKYMLLLLAYSRWMKYRRPDLFPEESDSTESAQPPEESREYPVHLRVLSASAGDTWITLDIARDATVGDLYWKASDAANSTGRLTFGDRRLQNRDDYLSDAGICAESVVEFITFPVTIRVHTYFGNSQFYDIRASSFAEFVINLKIAIRRGINRGIVRGVKLKDRLAELGDTLRGTLQEWGIKVPDDVQVDRALNTTAENYVTCELLLIEPPKS